VAGELGLLDSGGRVISGPELDLLDDDQLARRAEQVSVYARVSPEHKLRIVRAHQAQGSVVAMTGDGVNDAPALKQADIGVAMGITGTDVSKEAAKMVLADDNFATIVAAVEEGRIVYDNIRKFVRYLLTTNTGEVFLLFLAIVFGFDELPLLPIHLLWINLVTDGLPALALGFEPGERAVMKRPPRPRSESLFAGGMARDIFMLGLLMAGTSLALYQRLLEEHGAGEEGVAYARTAVFFAASMFQLFYVLSIRSETESIVTLGVRSNWRLSVAVVLGTVLQVLLVYMPLGQRIFHTTPLSIADLGLATLVGASGFVVAEIRKAARRHAALITREEAGAE
jgi:Ca2+-transporting ATPase